MRGIGEQVLVEDQLETRIIDVQPGGQLVIGDEVDLANEGGVALQ